MTDQLIFDPFGSRITTGINLIEASAGTGKTFSIAMLVLRGVVELGLEIDKILVVTYTSAATEELRERIRARLLAARRLLQAGRVDPSAADLRSWLDRAGPREQLARRLEVALLDIDRAPIQTIHAFCQTILQEQALESGQPFDLQVTADVTPVRDRLVQDFWRSRLYPLPERYGRLVCSVFAGPRPLYRSIAGAENLLCELLPRRLSLASAFAELDRCLVALNNWWLGAERDLQHCLAEAVHNGYLLAKTADLYPRLLADLTDSLGQNQAPPEDAVGWLLEERLLQGLHGNRLKGSEKKKEFLRGWPLPGEIVVAYCRSVQGLLCAFRLELARFLRSGLTERLRERGLICFDDLVTGLAAAVSAPTGEPLCRQVGARYQMALIDEFQDTDSAQWLIFSRFFGSGKHYLYLIGDPKQAIYRFRGADIYSYYAARQRADRRLTLDRNFRAHPGLMAAVNQLFQEVPIAGEPYRPVRAARTAEQGKLLESGRDGPHLIYGQLEPSPDGGRWTGEAAGEAIGAWVVHEAAKLLGGTGPRYREETPEANHGGRPLLPADLAVLVRTNAEATAYQDRFRRAGIPAVVTSRQSVFRSVQCRELLQVLQAVGSPTDVRQLKTALGCDWFGLDGDEHFRFCRDEWAMSSVQERFQGYFRQWQERGFLPMFTSLLRAEHVFLHLSRRLDAERSLANIQHLAELVQDRQQRGHLSVEQTLVWLHQVSTGAELVEASELRLETDARALQIVTMHSAKGLEFPVVFCPSLLTPVYQRQNLPLVFAHEDNGTRICDLGSDQFADHKRRALEEERQENLRLAYVAITRAGLRCYLAWADIKPWGGRPASFESSLGRLLFPDGPADYETQAAILQARGERISCSYRLIDQRALSAAGYQTPLTAPPDLRAREKKDRSLQPGRVRTSFSGLAMLSGDHGNEQPGGAYDEGRAGTGPVEGTALPAGVRFGTVVHEILETAAFTELARGGVDDATIAACCRKSGLTVDTAALRELLRRCVTTPLLAATEQRHGFTLADLDPGLLVKELSFVLQLKRISTRQVNELLAIDPACTPLSYKTIEGYLSGFVDLVCCHDDRYYIIDYKTNRLGDDERAYEQEGLQAAMRAHNYGLQYWLYTVVLHRYLRYWLPAYRYRRHFGGVIYPFVRAMRPDRPGSGVYFTLPDARTVQHLDQCFGAS